MTIFGRAKRKQASLEAFKNNEVEHIDTKKKNTQKSKSRVIEAQTTLNLAQAPPPPYPSSTPLPYGYWHPPQGPYQQYHPSKNPVSQVSLVARPPPPPPDNDIYKQNRKGKSCTNLPAAFTKPVQCLNHGIDALQHRPTDCMNPGAALCELISSKLDTVITLIDGERFSGDERELVIYQNPQPTIRGGGALATRDVSRSATNAIATAVTSTNYFAKANLYANARLPPNLPPLKLYLPTYPLLCLAAQYSQRVYTRPSGAERETHVDADWRLGTKAMVIKSVPIDDMNTVVFAIRGSQTFMDWAVNLNSAPASPNGFLVTHLPPDLNGDADEPQDDPGNLCHSGFLSVARKMVKPVAARLRSMLEEDPSRAGCSLLITGHSAGGAVASLLYAHMLAKEVKSELNILTGCFKRVHCITFGAPPISLLPIEKLPPGGPRKSLFLSFINEGDPVPRADKAYVRSLLDLYASPSPGSSCALIPSCPIRAKLSSPTHPQPQPQTSAPTNPSSTPTPITTMTSTLLKPLLPRPKPKPKPTKPHSNAQAPIWKVPPSTLSNAGRLILLRSRSGSSSSAGRPTPASAPTPSPAAPGTPIRIAGEEDVSMCVTTDEQLRAVVFGDPVMHMMRVYARRIEVLATRAVTARISGG
ncbi:hypothetical protein MMC16_004045 [Acarospora aff. strigata]|nr:hypothetical protein [Acarospora aff. strigata]